MVLQGSKSRKKVVFSGDVSDIGDVCQLVFRCMVLLTRDSCLPGRWQGIF